MSTVVFVKTWSERPMSVVGSYCILQLYLLVIIRSIQDLSSPLLNVLHAGGPGCNPLRMSQPYYSHMSKSHRVLWLVYLSSLNLVDCILSRVGARSAILVFQSPHIMVVSYGGKLPIVSSIKLLAMASSIPRFCWLMTGGRYTLPTHILSPPCICRHMPYVYSFPMYFKTLIPLRINMAIPPLFPEGLRSSKT
jgi:hypothetical protein